MIDVPHLTQAVWMHKKGDRYYLSYARSFPEKTRHATSDSVDGSWEYGRILNQIAGSSETNHPSIIELAGESYFIYHTRAVRPRGGGPSGGRFRRSLALDRLYSNEDVINDLRKGSIQ